MIHAWRERRRCGPCMVLQAQLDAAYKGWAHTAERRQEAEAELARVRAELAAARREVERLQTLAWHWQDDVSGIDVVLGLKREQQGPEGA